MRAPLLLPLLAASVSWSQSPHCGVVSEKRTQCRWEVSSSLRELDRLTLPLSLKAEKRLAYRDGMNDVWIGRLAGQPDSEVVLVAYDGQLIGNIRSAAGDFYAIRPSAGGQFEMRAVTAAEATRGLESLGLDGALAPVAAAAAPGALTQPLMVVASTIDVLVVYTQAAKTAAGGDNAIRARIALAIAEANAALTTSLVDASFRLVGTKELTPVSGVAEGPTPGYLADVTVDAAIIAERNATGADLVSVWINGTGASGGGAVGAGWIMSSPGPGFAPTAYSLVELNFALGPHYIFGRGLGQNLGGTTDRANAPGPGAFGYSYGFQSPAPAATAFMDIMASPTGCKLCVRKNYFANPAVTINTRAGGVASADPNGADLALTFNNTRTIVEAFRAPGVPNAPAPTPITSAFVKGLAANPARITAGETTRLYWETINATGLSLLATRLSGGSTTTVVTGTSTDVTPTETTLYTLTATDGGGGSSTSSVTVVVDPASTVVLPPVLVFPDLGIYTLAVGTPRTITPTSTGGPVQTCVSNPELPAGLTLSPQCEISGTPTTPQAATLYRFVYYNADGGRAQSISLTITGTPIPPPVVPAPVITSFTASPGTINAGQSSTLNWVVSNAATLTISGIGTVTGSSRSVTPPSTTTYVLTATNSVGAFVTALATVTVNTPGGGGPSPVISFTSPTANQTISGIWYFQVAVPASISAVSGLLKIDGNLPYPLFSAQDGFTTGVNTARFAPGTHTATATVTDKANVDYTATVIFVIGTPPVVPPPVISSFLATPASIAAGQSSTLTWTVTNAASLSISSIGPVTGTSTSVTPAATTTYVLTATNSDGVSVTAPATVTVNAVPPPPSGTGITILTPTSGQNVSGVTFITASVTGFAPVNGWLDLAVGNFRTGKALSNGAGQFTGGLNLNGLAMGATSLTVSATGTNGVFYSSTIPLVLVAP